MHKKAGADPENCSRVGTLFTSSYGAPGPWARRGRVPLADGPRSAGLIATSWASWLTGSGLELLVGETVRGRVPQRVQGVGVPDRWTTRRRASGRWAQVRGVVGR